MREKTGNHSLISLIFLCFPRGFPTFLLSGGILFVRESVMSLFKQKMARQQSVKAVQAGGNTHEIAQFLIHIFSQRIGLLSSFIRPLNSMEGLIMRATRSFRGYPQVKKNRWWTGKKANGFFWGKEFTGTLNGSWICEFFRKFMRLMTPLSCHKLKTVRK